MKNFTSGLPDHFILFSQTPKAQEQSRRILLRFAIVLTVPLLAMVLFGATIISGFFVILLLCHSLDWIETIERLATDSFCCQSIASDDGIGFTKESRGHDSLA